MLIVRRSDRVIAASINGYGYYVRIVTVGDDVPLLSLDCVGNCIYVFSSGELVGKVKIGRVSKFDLQSRVNDLCGWSLYLNCVVDLFVFSGDISLWENKIHSYLKSFRDVGEFFNMSRDDACSIIESLRVNRLDTVPTRLPRTVRQCVIRINGKVVSKHPDDQVWIVICADNSRSIVKICAPATVVNKFLPVCPSRAAYVDYYAIPNDCNMKGLMHLFKLAFSGRWISDTVVKIDGSSLNKAMNNLLTSSLMRSPDKNSTLDKYASMMQYNAHSPGELCFK